MMKTIIYARAAEKELLSLPLRDQEAIEAALQTYALSGRGDVKPLAGELGFRMRVGSYRVIFDEDRTTILAFQIGRRSTTTYRRS
jgi:mRNA interferase RelE/StbE